MKIIKEMNKLSIEVVRAINLTFVNETPFSLFTSIATTPKIGIKSKDNNNIYKKKKLISTSLWSIV